MALEPYSIRRVWTIAGVDSHGQTIADKYTADEVRAKYGEKFTLEPRPRKHRYVYLNARGRRRAALLAALRYPTQPYPRAADGPAFAGPLDSA